MLDNWKTIYFQSIDTKAEKAEECFFFSSSKKSKEDINGSGLKGGFWDLAINTVHQTKFYTPPKKVKTVRFC